MSKDDYMVSGKAVKPSNCPDPAAPVQLSRTSLSSEDEAASHVLSSLQIVGIKNLMVDVSNEILHASYSAKDPDAFAGMKYLQGQLDILAHILALSDSYGSV